MRITHKDVLYGGGGGDFRKLPKTNFCDKCFRTDRTPRLIKRIYMYIVQTDSNSLTLRLRITRVRNSPPPRQTKPAIHVCSYPCCLSSNSLLSVHPFPRSKSAHGNYRTVTTSWTTPNQSIPARPSSLVECHAHSKLASWLTFSTPDTATSAMPGLTVTPS